MKKLREYFASELIIFFPLIIFWFELVVKFSSFNIKDIFVIDYLMTFSLSTLISLLIYLVYINLPRKIGNIVVVILYSFITFLYATQIVYFHKFDTFITVYTLLFGSGNAKEFSYQAYLAFYERLPIIALLLIPLIFFIYGLIKYAPKNRASIFQSIMTSIVSLCVLLIAIIVFIFSNSGIMTAQKTQENKFILEPSIKNIGIISTMIKDFHYHIMDFEPKPQVN